jgi:hypothetical protein
MVVGALGRAMDSIIKFPRTRHIRGSRLQDGDEDLEAEPFETIRGKHLVVESKIDGANSGISFDSDTLELPWALSGRRGA